MRIDARPGQLLRALLAEREDELVNLAHRQPPNRWRVVPFVDGGAGQRNTYFTDESIY